MVFALLLPSMSVFAQGVGITTGTLSGDVKDEAGASIFGVLIHVSSNSGTKTAHTDANGKYIFPYLNPGSYDVRAELQGFDSVEQNNVRIGLGQRIEISFRMKPAIHETVTIVNESPLVDLTSTTIGANISDKLTEKIPIGRSLANIIYLAPGVVRSGLAGSNFSISGGSGWDNTYIVDGAVVTNPGFGTMGAVTFNQNYFSLTEQDDSGLPVEMIQEVQVITGGFEPEYGETQGGIINVVTKSGSNDFHGQTYIYTTPQSAGDELIHEENSLDTGASFGGPILKNKLFFYGAYNLTTFKNTYFVQPEWPGYSLVKEVEEKGRTDSYSIKITANVTPQHTLNLSVIGDPSYLPLSNHDGYQLDTSVDPRKLQSIVHFGTNTQTLRWTATFHPSMFLEAQFAHSQNDYLNNPDPRYKDLPYIFDETGGIETGGFGAHPDMHGRNLQYSAKFTNIWKTHQFRYGLQFQDISYWSDHTRSGGPFRLSNGQESQGYFMYILDGKDYGLDKVYRVNALVPPVTTRTRTEYLNWFVQDSWNLSSALNINFGIRWEQQQIKGEGEDSLGTTFGNNWAPRVGATFDYLNNGKSKLFFNYGRYFEKIPNEVARAFTTRKAEWKYFADPNLTQPLGIEAVLFERLILEVEGHENSTSSFRAGAQFLDEWIAGIEQEVSGFSLGARFIHRNMGRVVEDIVVNQDAPCVPISTGGCVYAPTTIEEQISDPSLIGVITNVDGHIPGLPALTRDYNALEITAQKRLSSRWQLLGSYRYAHLTGNYEGGDQNAGSAGNFALSPFTQFTWAEGPLPNDIRHMVKLFGSYQLLSNLNTGVAFYFQTGRPITRLVDVVDYGIFLLSPRGDLGRTDSVTSVDVHADYAIPIFRKQQVSVGMDIFNVFNVQAVTSVEELGGEVFADDLTNVVTYDYFLGPLDYQPSRTIRFVLRYSF